MKRVCLFCGSNVGARAVYAQAAGDLGRALAAHRITLVYGGGSVGLMKIAAEAALAGGGEVIGVITGGFGTFDEFCEMATWDQLGIHVKPLVLVNVDGYFDGFLAQIDRGVADGFLKPEHRTMLAVVDRIDAVFAALEGWQAPPVAQWLQGPAPKP